VKALEGKPGEAPGRRAWLEQSVQTPRVIDSIRRVGMGVSVRDWVDRAREEFSSEISICFRLRNSTGHDGGGEGTWRSGGEI
jgi:hypothetical protein